MKTCKICKGRFAPPQGRKNARVCSPECALADVRANRRKAEERAARRSKREFLENDRSWQIKKTQEAFNAFIRLRDQGKPCVSCGRFHQGQYHAGHYRTTAAQSALRFNELNCHRQCAPCNNHKSGNITEYRIELMRRIGEPLVEWLEKDHPPCKWSIEELKAIREYYKRAAREMMMTPGAAEPF